MRETFLGDGVYVRYDDNLLRLRGARYGEEQVVRLTPNTVLALERYLEQTRLEREKRIRR